MKSTLATLAASSLLLAGLGPAPAAATSTHVNPTAKFFLSEPLAVPENITLFPTSRGVMVSAFIPSLGGPQYFYTEYVTGDEPYFLDQATCEDLGIYLIQPAASRSYFVNFDAEVLRYSGPTTACKDAGDPDPLEIVADLHPAKATFAIQTPGATILMTDARSVVAVFDRAGESPLSTDVTPTRVASGPLGATALQAAAWWNAYGLSPVLGVPQEFREASPVLLTSGNDALDPLSPDESRFLIFPGDPFVVDGPPPGSIEVPIANLVNGDDPLIALETAFFGFGPDSDLVKQYKVFMSGLVDVGGTPQFRLYELIDATPDVNNEAVGSITDVTGTYVSAALAERLVARVLYPLGEVNGRPFFSAAHQRYDSDPDPQQVSDPGIYSFSADRGLYLVPGTENLQPLRTNYLEYEPSTSAVDGELWLPVREIPENLPNDLDTLPNQIIALTSNGFTTKLTAPVGGQIHPSFAVSNGEVWVVTTQPTLGVALAVFDLADFSIASAPTQNQNQTPSQPSLSPQDFQLATELSAYQTELTITTRQQITAIEIAGEQLFFRKTATGYLVQLPISIANTTTTSQTRKLRIQTPIGSVEFTLIISALTARPLDNIVDSAIKRNGNTVRVALYDLVNSGKAQIMLNGEEVAWVRATDESDPKLRQAPQGHHLLRTLKLEPGKNVIEIYQNGQRLRRVAHTN